MKTVERKGTYSTFGVFWVMGGWVAIGLWAVTVVIGILRVFGDDKISPMLVVIPGLLGCAALWFCGHRTVQGILARRMGREAIAYVTALPSKGFDDGKAKYGSMSFQTVDYEAGQSATANIRKFETFHIGTELTVFVRNGEAWWAGDVGTRPEILNGVPDVAARQHRRHVRWSKIRGFRVE